MHSAKIAIYWFGKYWWDYQYVGKNVKILWWIYTNIDVIFPNRDWVWRSILELPLYFLFSLYMFTTWRPKMANYQYKISFHFVVNRTSASTTRIDLSHATYHHGTNNGRSAISPQPNLTPVFLDYSFFVATSPQIQDIFGTWFLAQTLTLLKAP